MMKFYSVLICEDSTVREIAMTPEAMAILAKRAEPAIKYNSVSGGHYDLIPFGAAETDGENIAANLLAGSSGHVGGYIIAERDSDPTTGAHEIFQSHTMCGFAIETTRWWINHLWMCKGENHNVGIG